MVVSPFLIVSLYLVSHHNDWCLLINLGILCIYVVFPLPQMRVIWWRKVSIFHPDLKIFTKAILFKQWKWVHSWGHLVLSNRLLFLQELTLSIYHRVSEAQLCSTEYFLISVINGRERGLALSSVCFALLQIHYTPNVISFLSS